MVAVIALVVAGLVGSGWSLGFRLGNAHNGLLALSFTAVGLYVVRMRPRHREAVLFVAVGILHAVMFFGRQYGSHDGPLPAAQWIGWIGVWPLSLAIALAGWTLMAFPDGRLLSPRWRVAVGGMLALGFGLSLVSALWPVDYDRTALVVPHPLDVPGADLAESLWGAARASYPLFQIVWTAAILVRIHRARGDEVRQMRWLVYAVVVDIALLAGGAVLAGSPAPGLLALPLVPVAAGIAILKYRLYDIDPVINKTIVIGAMVLAITAGYVAVVLGIGALVPAGRGLLWLITTAVVAVVSEPLRRRAQRVADRVVYGHRTTPYEALAQLTARIQGPPEELLVGIATTVANAVGAREVVVWVGDDDRLVPAAAWPATVDDTARTLREVDRPRWHVRPVAHCGTVLGALALRKPAGETLTVAEDRLLSDLVAQTALVIVQQRQAEQLQAAARRIVTAEDAARRRIERDLHDGAQQRLVTLGLELGLLAERATMDPGLAARVREARTQLLDATSELRELARGLHPMVLTEQGLEAALDALADRSSVPVKLSVVLDDRLPREIEATTYFLVSEALTNAARHSDARLVRVCVTKVDAGLRVEVSDDGRGGATRSDGGGLQGVADRLGALGARLQLDSPAGSGTRITTVLPCA
ncbi:MAG: histidine kinase [Acidimicrobiales bacterium]